MPRYVSVELTRGCNLACGMCRSQRIPFGKFDMDEVTFYKTAKTLFSTTQIVDLRGWGESILHPLFTDYLGIILHYGAIPRIVTNLSLRNNKALKVLIESDALITISLDAASQSLLNLLRKGANLKIISDNIHKITESQVASKNKVKIHTVVGRKNMNELNSILNFANDHKIKNISLAENSQDRPKKNKTNLNLLEIFEKKATEYGTKIEYTTAIGGHRSNPCSEHPCCHPWTYATVSYKGNIGYCDHLIGEKYDSLGIGNIHNKEFFRLWNSEKTINIRKAHLEKNKNLLKLPKKCYWCYQYRFNEFENFFHKKTPFHCPNSKRA